MKVQDKVELRSTPISEAEQPVQVSTAVCAWCHPRQPGSNETILSHGICARHLQQLKLETQKIYRSSKPAEPVRQTDDFAPSETDLVAAVAH